MSKKRSDLIPLDCVNLPASFISLCLSVLVSEVHREVTQSCPVFLQVCLCVSTVHASVSPCYRCLGEIGKEGDENKRCKIVWGVEENSFWNLGPQKWMFEQRRWSLNTVGVHVEFSHIHVDQLLLFLKPEDISNFNNFLFYLFLCIPGVPSNYFCEIINYCLLWEAEMEYLRIKFSHSSEGICFARNCQEIIRKCGWNQICVINGEAPVGMEWKIVKVHFKTAQKMLWMSLKCLWNACHRFLNTISFSCWSCYIKEAVTVLRFCFLTANMASKTQKKQ